MARRNSDRGQGNEGSERDGQGGARRKGSGSGYSQKPKSSKMGLCKDLKSNVLFGGHNAANTMRVTQEKNLQYEGTKYGEDTANELSNKATVVLQPPK